MTLEEFEKCIVRDGDSINCIYGLWGVTCADECDREREAIHYWKQYKSDGEYHKIIGGMSPANIMMAKIC